MVNAMENRLHWLRSISGKVYDIHQYVSSERSPDEMLLAKDILDSLYAEYVKAFCMAPAGQPNLLSYAPILLDARKSIDEHFAEQQPPTVSAVPVPQDVKCRGSAQAGSTSPSSATTNSAKKRRIAFEAQFLPLLSSGEIKTRKELADLIDKVDIALITAKLLANEDEKHGAITDGLLICLVKAKLKEPVVSELHNLFDDDKLYTWEEFKKEVGNPKN